MIFGSNFPSRDVKSIVVCRWNTSFTTLGQNFNASHVSCPVPSVFKFRPYSTSVIFYDMDLELSFSAKSPLYILVPIKLIRFVITSPDGVLTVFPNQSFSSMPGANLTITGTGFVAGGPEVRPSVGSILGMELNLSL